MKPQLFALLTAIAWGVGGYFEKKGLHLGNLSPQMGITIRTFTASYHFGDCQLSAMENCSSGWVKSLAVHGDRWRSCSWCIGNALFLYRSQGRSPDKSHANCLYFSPLWRVNGHYICR